MLIMLESRTRPFGIGVFDALRSWLTRKGSAILCSILRITEGNF